MTKKEFEQILDIVDKASLCCSPCTKSDIYEKLESMRAEQKLARKNQSKETKTMDNV